MTEEQLLLALLALGALNLFAVVVGWIADRHITRTARHRKEG
ncbi:hypothetical protein ACWCXC_17205 [Streptomyces sp. NPDC001515]